MSTKQTLVIVLIIRAFLFPAGDVEAAEISIQGNSMFVWQRQYRLGLNGLPAEVYSNGKPMLTAPTEIDASLGGVSLRGQTPVFRWVAKSRDECRWRSVYRVGDAGLVIDGFAEPDGMMRFDLVFAGPSSTRLDYLRIAITVNQKHSTLMHSYPLPRNWPKVTYFDYRHPNSIATRDQWESPFTPFVWLGDEERGLEWFCESDEGWRPNDPGKVLQLVRGSNSVKLTVNVVEQPVTLGEFSRLTFGLQAGPVKPPRRDFRQMHFGYVHWAQYGMESQPEPGSDPPCTKLERLKALGVRFIGFHEDWTDYQGMPRVTNSDGLRSLVEKAHDTGIGVVLYHSMAIPDIAPEYESLGAKCRAEPVGALYIHTREPKQKDYPACYRSEWSKLWLDGIARLVQEYDIDGVYLDGAASPFPCANREHGCGYVDSSGVLKATYNIFACREQMKQLAAIFAGRKRPTLIVAHMSGQITLPTLSFADVLLTGEQYWKSPMDFRPPLDFFRVECMGHNHGIPTHFIGYRPLGGQWARTMIALHNAPSPWSPGGTDMWRLYNEFDVDGASWTPYWHESDIVSVEPDGVKLSFFLHPKNGGLLVVGNVIQSAVEARIKIADLSALGAGARPKITDALTGDRLDVVELDAKGTTMSVSLGPEECKSLRFGR